MEEQYEDEIKAIKALLKVFQELNAMMEPIILLQCDRSS